MGNCLEIGVQTPLIEGSIVTGRVVEVQAQSAFQSVPGKIAALVFDGQPWQFGQQVHRTTIFLEPLSSYSGDSSTEQRAIVFQGDMGGAVCRGNIVQAKVRKKRGVLVVRQMNNLTTRSPVVSATQFGGFALAAFSGALLILALLFLSAVVRCILDGSLAAGIVSLLCGLAEGLFPLIAVGLLGFAILGSLKS